MERYITGHYKNRIKCISYDPLFKWAHIDFMSKRQIKKHIPDASILKNFDRRKNVIIFLDENDLSNPIICLDDKETVVQVLKDKVRFDGRSWIYSEVTLNMT